MRQPVFTHKTGRLSSDRLLTFKMSTLVCFLCNKDSNETRITLFSLDTFNKCRDMLAYRKTRGFKYGDGELAPELRDGGGYHLQCYRKFMVLKGMYQQDFKTFQQHLPKLCCVYQCFSNTDQMLIENHVPKITFSFPTEETLREIWFKLVGRKPTDSASICIDHFLESDFLTTDQKFEPVFPQLKPNAVPSVGLSIPPEPKKQKYSRSVHPNYSRLSKKIKLDHGIQDLLEPTADLVDDSDEYQSSDQVVRQFHKAHRKAIVGVCSLYGCNSNQISVFSFPRRHQRLNWLHVLGLDRVPAKGFICSAHFEVNDLVERNGNIFLRREALPINNFKYIQAQDNRYPSEIKLEPDVYEEVQSSDDSENESDVDTKNFQQSLNISQPLIYFCRLCAQTSDMYKKMTAEIKKMITECISLDINENHENDLPDHICEKCLQNLTYCYEFRNNCLIANNHLQLMSSNQTPIKNETIEIQSLAPNLNVMEKYNANKTPDSRQKKVFKKYKCYNCDSAFVGSSFLKDHAQIIHSEDILEPDLHEDPFRIHLYICRICGEVSDNFNVFQQHSHFQQNQTFSFSALQMLTKNIIFYEDD